VPPARLNLKLPVELERIIDRAIEKDRGLRYQTAAELRAELKRLKRDTESGRSTAFAMPAAVPKPVRTNWSRLGLLVGSLVLILVALGFAWYKWRNASSVRLTEPTERQLTTNPPEDWVRTAAISPDGKYMAYVDQSGLLLRSIDSGEIHAIPLDFSAAGIGDMKWFPEGGKLLVTREGPEMGSIWAFTLFGQVKSQMLREAAEFPAISPDGKSMAFIGGPLWTAEEVWVSGISGEAPRKLAPAEVDQELNHPVWSPDGHWIAYWERRKDISNSFDTSIEIRPAAGGPAKTLVSESSLPKSSTLDFWDGAIWLPDWRVVYAVSESSELHSAHTNNSLWQVRIDPNNGQPFEKPQRLFQWGDFEPSDMTITADGKTLAFVKTRSNQDVYIGELDQAGTTLRAPGRFTLDTHNSRREAWTPDSRSIFFSSDRNGKSELFRQGLNDRVPERIVSSGAGDIYGATLSPDGVWILYGESVRTEGKAPPSSLRVMRQPATGGPPETVLELPYSDGERFSCPRKVGQPCVLGQIEGKNLVFYTLDPVHGKGELLNKIEIDTGFNDWQVSPDGSQLAVVDDLSHKNRIEVLNLSNKVWREIAVEAGWGDNQTIAWAADGKSFFVTTWLPESWNLVHVTLSGKVQRLLSNPNRQFMFRPLPSPDGKHLAFQAQTFDSNVWLLQNF
jgi:Tol biopolymer transport system component